MGYVLAHSACIGCGRFISYNPHHVPSIRVHGVREPVCRDCADIVNAKRVKDGLAPQPIHPDAYEPIDERDL